MQLKKKAAKMQEEQGTDNQYRAGRKRIRKKRKRKAVEQKGRKHIRRKKYR